VIETMIGILAFMSIKTNDAEGFSFIVFLLWGAAVMSLGVLGANTIVSERVHQTLEVLLTTPLTAGEIVAQKARALRRLILVFTIPLLSMGFLQLWIDPYSFSQRTGSPVSILNLVVLLMSLLIFLPLFAWLSLWIGLKIRSRFRAIITALGVILFWCLGGPMIIILATSPRTPFWILLFSPTTLVVVNQGNSFSSLFEGKHGATPTMIDAILLLVFAGYAVLLFLIRGLCLRNADRYLRASNRCFT
jgi:ABC-type Na+ efflux pump permease subunit